MKAPKASTAAPSPASPILRLRPVVIYHSPGLQGASRGGGLLLQQAKLVEDALDAGLLIPQEPGELVGGKVAVDPAAFGGYRLPLRAANHLAHGRIQRLEVGGLDVAGRHDCAPVDQFDIDALFLKRRDIDTRQ